MVLSFFGTSATKKRPKRRTKERYAVLHFLEPSIFRVYVDGMIPGKRRNGFIRADAGKILSQLRNRLEDSPSKKKTLGSNFGENGSQSK